VWNVSHIPIEYIFFNKGGFHITCCFKLMQSTTWEVPVRLCACAHSWPIFIGECDDNFTAAVCVSVCVSTMITRLMLAAHRQSRGDAEEQLWIWDHCSMSSERNSMSESVFVFVCVSHTLDRIYRNQLIRWVCQQLTVHTEPSSSKKIHVFMLDYIAR